MKSLGQMTEEELRQILQDGENALRNVKGYRAVARIKQRMVEAKAVLNVLTTTKPTS